MSHPLINFLAFQCAWFACVLGAAYALPALGPLVVLIWLTAHLRALGERRAGEAWLVLIAAAIGYVLDSTLVLAGAMSFPPQTWLGGPSPLWMVALWAGFAATLGFALRWLHGRYVLAAVLGAVFGPGAYSGGEALGAVSITPWPFGPVAVGIEWALAMPVLLWVSKRLAPDAASAIVRNGQAKA